jgi:thiol-disulfide isomerase/thioredoxin
MTEGNKLLGNPATRADGIARYDEACRIYAGVLTDLDALPLPPGATDQIRQIAHYNMACARSLQGRHDEALGSLESAIDAGWADLDHMAKDTDLDNIRNLPGYAKLIEKVKSAAGKVEAEELDKARAEARKALSQGKKFDYDFSITTLDGKPLKLAQLRGKVVIVDFWGTWCPPCREEIPHFVALKKAYGDRLAIVGMTFENGESGPAVEAKVRAFAKKHGINYDLTLLDSPEELRKVPGFRAFPTTLFIDKAGRVRAVEVGYRPMAFLKAMVEQLDGEPGATPQPAQPAKKTPSSSDGEWF